MTQLTPREQEVYELIVTEGMRKIDMAERLGITYNTVHRHIVNIFEKTGAESMIQLVVWHYTKRRRVCNHKRIRRALETIRAEVERL